MKKYIFLCLSIFFLSCSDTDTTIMESKESPVKKELIVIHDFSKSFSGKIDDQYEVVMNLHLKGETITGSYYYTKYNKIIRLNGTFNPIDNSFKMVEFATGEDHTGEFAGSIQNDFSLSGTWAAFSKAVSRETPLSFEAKESVFKFEWYSKGAQQLPFHPYQVAMFLGMGDSEDEADITEVVQMPENYKLYENTDGVSFGYTIEYDDDFSLRTPYFEYELLGQKGNLFIVSVSESGGGTGIFSGISILELNGTILTKNSSICGGDRCNGGIGEASYKDGIIYYSQNVTSEDLYFMADESIKKPDVSLDYCAMCCSGEAYFTYNLAEKTTSFISFENFLDDVDVDPAAPNDLDIFYHLMFEHTEKNGGKMDQNQLDEFISVFVSIIAS